jgi:8-oxo-dGTP pyrophosphatase MutT (NUDIX family)
VGRHGGDAPADRSGVVHLSGLGTFLPSPVLLPRTSFSFDPSHAAAALIVVDGDRLLLQRRDDIVGVLYPDCWGCFGGARNADESAEDALRRELKEELGLDVDRAEYFTAVNYDFRFCGKGITLREYYVIPIDAGVLGTLKLGEGQAMAAMTPEKIFALPNIIPFDLFAIWLYSHREALAK